MTKLIGSILLFLYLIITLWIFLRIMAEGNYLVNRKLKKSGYKSYKKYKKDINKNKTEI